MYDTVRLQSPEVSEQTAQAVESLLTRRQAVKLATGEVLYEFTSESLLGSWDARVMVQVKRERWVVKQGSKIPVRVVSKPYLVVEASVHKLMLGHNVYGGPTHFQPAMRWFVAFLAYQLGQELPDTSSWIVQRIDIAEAYDLGSWEACEEYIRSLQVAEYARRKVHRYGGETIFAPGTTTAIRAYHKGPEFSKHDGKRLKLLVEADQLEGLQLMANGILRVETEIKSKKLQEAFNGMPLVGNVTDGVVTKIHDREVLRLLKEGQSDVETVRTHQQVSRRLYEWYTAPQAGALYATWLRLATLGEHEVRRDLPRRTWYDHKKKLLDAGCAWSGTDVLTFRTLIPQGFAPVRTDPRRLIEEAFEVSSQMALFS